MRTLSALACSATLGTVLLAACSGVRTVSSDVASYGEWPADRKPASFAFDRLPSQQAQASETERLESAARPALEKAGFIAAPEGQTPDVLVQVGARTTRYDRYAWDDPIWWRGGFGYWRHAPWPGPYWGGAPRYDRPRYDREVALLMRDRGTGKPLFETHASNEGGTGLDNDSLQAMFEAALMDFPKLGVNPRRVVVSLPPQ